MKLKLFLLLVYCLLITYLAHSQGVNITSWQMNTTGHKAQYYNSSNVLTTLTDSSDVQEVCYNTDTVYVRANSLGSFIMGPWPGDPFTAAGQNYSYVFPRNPTYPASTHANLFVGMCGLWINGVAIYTAGDGKSYKSSTGTHSNSGDGNWNCIAWVAHINEMDDGGGHPDPNQIYHNHSNPYQLYDSTAKTVHSPLLGWAFDGFPIYGPYGYSSATDATSAIKRMEVSYQLRNISNRSSTSPAGPSINATFPLGTYIEDYEYVSSSGDLDEYNGRYCVTPEFPSGTYAYFLGTNADGTPTYPNILAEKYYGSKTYPTNFGPSGGNASKPKSGVSCVSTTASTPTVTLTTGTSSISETGGSTTVTATLSSTSTSNVTVTLALSGTATVTSDYTLSTSITITAGNTSASIMLSSVSDTKDENNETVIIDISSVTNGTESGTQQKTVTINDDDAAPSVTLSAASSSISETGGSSVITATLSAISGLDVTINLSTGGSATVTSDYTLANSITITAGNTTGTITLSSVSDTKDEDNETVVIEISSVTNGSESGTQQQTVTINDDDAAPTVTLSASGTSVSETSGTATITATLSAASGKNVTVDLSTSGTATITSDYTLASSISIAAGSTTGTATLSCVNDALDEDDETVIIDIFSVTNGTESTPQQRTITIVDNSINGIYQAIDIKASIYPNPTVGTFSIDLTEEPTKIIVRDNKGSIVTIVSNPELKNTIDLGELENGLYAIQLVSEKGVSVRKINLQK